MSCFPGEWQGVPGLAKCELSCGLSWVTLPMGRHSLARPVLGHLSMRCTLFKLSFVTPRSSLCDAYAAWVSSCLPAMGSQGVGGRGNILFMFHEGKAIWKAVVCNVRSV